MRLVFDINAEDMTYEIANDIRDFINTVIERRGDSFLLPSPDLYASSPLLERKYKFMVYSLGGNLLSDANWMKVFKVLSINFDNPYNGMAVYNEDWWQSIYPYTVGTVSSKSYDTSYSELLKVITERYADINGVYEGDVDIEWLTFNDCNIYSEETGKIISVDDIGSRTLVSVLYTKPILKAIMDNADLYPASTCIKVYCVENDVFSEDDDDDVIDYDEAV